MQFNISENELNLLKLSLNLLCNLFLLKYSLPMLYDLYRSTMFAIYHADIEELWKQFEVESIDELNLKSDTKIFCKWKLHRAYKLTHSTSHACEFKDITSNGDSDTEFLKSKAISKFLFPEKWTAFKLHDDSPLSFEKVTSTIKDKIMETIFRKKSDQDIFREVSIIKLNFIDHQQKLLLC